MEQNVLGDRSDLPADELITFEDLENRLKKTYSQFVAELDGKDHTY